MEAIEDASVGAVAGENPLEKPIYILVNSRLGTSAVGMFKFNIKIINNANNSCTRNEKKQASSLVVVISAGEGETERDHFLLKPEKCFFNQNPYKPIARVAYCQIRSFPEELYLIPEDARIPNRESVSPFIFNFKTNTTTPFNLPLETKWDPIAAALGKKVYVLATGSINKSPEPRFESYCPAKSEWTHLIKFPYSAGENYVSGYVVLEDRFIVVCISCYDANMKPQFYSYSTLSGEWKHVNQAPPDAHPSTTNGKIYPALFGEGVVLFDSVTGDNCDGIIYSYTSQFEELLAFPYTKVRDISEPPERDLSLGHAYRVKGFQAKRILTDNGDAVPFAFESGAIAKVDHDILCVLYGNPYISADPVMEVSGSIIQIPNDYTASCTILKTFTCALFLGDSLCAAHIKSCLVLQLKEQKDDLASEKEMDYIYTSDDEDKMEV